MNNLEKKSFFLFLGLYIFSSTFFILLSANFYYNSKKTSLEKKEYYLLQHLVDKVSQEIIYAHMTQNTFKHPQLDKGVHLALVDVNKSLRYGKLPQGFVVNKAEYRTFDPYKILVSDAPQKHLNIEYVVVYSKVLSLEIVSLQRTILLIMVVSIVMMTLFAWLLAKLFMRPLRERIEQIEEFVHDTAHELNTPITALSMSVSRALRKGVYDEKTLKNISISTKQLFDIYRALSYLSFESEKEVAKALNICTVLEKSIKYYEELAQSKKISLEVNCQEFMFQIDTVKLTMLFGNLINNAIKYSHPNTKIIINFRDGIFSIQDFGIGISQENQEKIFERFRRGTTHAGGFGIGLSIVKKISNEYHLTLSLDSKIDEGSTFFIDFN